MKASKICVLALFAAAATAGTARTGGHEEEQHDEEDVIVMTAQERAAQGIGTERVSNRVLADTITAPGEVRLNAYVTAQVLSVNGGMR